MATTQRPAEAIESMNTWICPDTAHAKTTENKETVNEHYNKIRSKTKIKRTGIPLWKPEIPVGRIEE